MTRQRRNHDVEGIRCATAMRRWIRERIDDLHLLDDGAGPSVRDDHRKSIRILRAHVDEMYVQTVDVRHELRQRVELRFASAPVVTRYPVVSELPGRRELHTL